MKLRNRCTAFLLGAAFFLVGCGSTPYTPSPDRPFEPITEFTSNAAVSLVNVQTDTEQHAYGGRMSANYQEWTDVAIQIAERELTKRGMRVQPGGRTLKMAITHARYRVGWVKLSTRIEMTVETGSGYTATYEGLNSSVLMAVPKRQVDGAMMRVVVEMLKDPEIVRYLTDGA